jgi:hypothetical protein
LWCRVENLEGPFEVFVEFQYGGDVTAAVAVIGGAPYGNQGIMEHAAVSFHDELVGAGDETEVVAFVKDGDNVTAKKVAGTARRQSPSLEFFRVTPHEIAHGSIVRDFLFPINDPNLIQR